MITNNYIVEEVSSRADLDAVAECIWTTMSASDAGHHIFFPVLNGDKPAALQECKDRLWAEHTGDPSSHWIFVRDASSVGTSTTFTALGVCQWRFYTDNPFPDGVPEIIATWWPEGEGREFATEFVRQVLTPRATYMARPHSGLSWCAVLPTHQRRGIGQALMSWGVTRSDELGLESYIEATEAGSRLYRKFGYRTMGRVDVDMKGMKRSGAEWERLEKDILPAGCALMWRPVNGEWEEGQTERIWKERIGS